MKGVSILSHICYSNSIYGIMVLLCSGAKYIGRISSYKKCYISDKKETLKKFPNKDKISDLSCVYGINCLLLQIKISSKTIEIVSLFLFEKIKNQVLATMLRTFTFTSLDYRNNHYGNNYYDKSI